MKSKIKKGDRVIVLAGRDKGKTGEVTAVFPRKSLATVQGVNMVKRHQRPTATSAGGIVEKEGMIHLSNLSHLDPEDGKPCRVGYRFQDNRKVRFSRRSNEVIDS